MAAIETTDRISHMMWRLIDPRHPMYDAELAAKYGDSIEKVYRRADDFVGRLRQKVPKDALFMVMSDHGFHSFRREVNLNTWLVQNGYMVVHGAEPGEDAAGPVRPRQVLRGRRLVADEGLRGRPRPDLLQPEGPREPGHRLRRRGVPGAAGGDPDEAGDAHRPRDGRAGLRRRLPARRHLQGRVHPDGARPAGRLPRRLPRGLAGHARHDPPRGGREQQQEVVGRPLRDRHRDQPRGLLLQPEDRRTPSRRSWTSRRRS